MLEKKQEWSGNGTMNGSKSNLNGSQEETTDYLFSKNQLRQVVREILAEMLGIQSQIQDQRQWYDTDPAYELLGLDEAEQLREAVRSGLLRIGHEVRDRRKPQAKLPRYQFHIERCQKRLLDKPELRKRV